MFSTFTRRSPRLEAAGPVTSDADLFAQITEALAPRTAGWRFGTAIARRYEKDTGALRVCHLRRMIVLGLCFLNIYDVMGFVTLPRFGWANVVLRLFVMTPTALGVAFIVDKVDDKKREAITAIAMLGAAGIPLLLFSLSDEPLAPLTSAEVLLSVVYANTTLALRFQWACITSAAINAGTLAGLVVKPEIGLGLASAIMVNLVTASVFSLMANYRIEWSERRAYLLTLQETLRVTSLSADKDALMQLSGTDALTGLANRRVLQDRTPVLDRDLERGRPLAVIMLDVDHFKRFNDFYGHDAGDDCLQKLSRFFASVVGGDDQFVVRFGGEEFVAVLPDHTATAAVATAERLRLGVEALGIPHFARRDRQTVVTISLGIAAARASEPATVAALIKKADSALYAAKASGRNQARLAIGAPGRAGDSGDNRKGGTSTAA